MVWSATGRRSVQLLFWVGTDNLMSAAVHCHLWLWHSLHEITRHQHRLCLLHCTASAMMHPPIRPQIRFPVAGNITGFITAGLRKFNPCHYSAVLSQTSPVGDELLCTNTNGELLLCECFADICNMQHCNWYIGADLSAWLGPQHGTAGEVHLLSTRSVLVFPALAQQAELFT